MATKLPQTEISTVKKHGGKESTDPVSEKNEKSPRLPHERDESVDSQQDPPREEIKQAFDDINEGQMDTDRRGIPGVEEVERKKPGNVQEDIPASSRIPPSIPKK
jgi:hypothetical protein